jgi:hypothetical protein
MTAYLPITMTTMHAASISRLPTGKQHAAHLACAARYRCQAEGLIGKANDDGPFGWKGPWGGDPAVLRASAKQAMKFARQEIEAARNIRIGR